MQVKSPPAIRALEVTWLMDDLYSTLVREDFDKDGDGALNEAELAEVVGTVAESQGGVVLMPKDSRTLADIDQLDQRVDRGFAGTQSMVRLSYAEIDRRFGALETEVSDLRSRV